MYDMHSHVQACVCMCLCVQVCRCVLGSIVQDSRPALPRGTVAWVGLPFRSTGLEFHGGPPAWGCLVPAHTLSPGTP